MLTLKDCLDMCDLDEEEVEAIARHEHVPEIVAIALAEYLVHTENGIPMIRSMILDDIAEAETNGNRKEAERLRLVLKHFIATHPDYVPRGGGGSDPQAR